MTRTMVYSCPRMGFDNEVPLMAELFGSSIVMRELRATGVGKPQRFMDDFDQTYTFIPEGALLLTYRNQKRCKSFLRQYNLGATLLSYQNAMFMVENAGKYKKSSQQQF